MSEMMNGFFEKVTPCLNNIYKFEIKNGNAMPPEPKLPDCVVERLNFFMPMREEGMTFLGILNCVLAIDEEQAKKDYSFGAVEDWLPVTDDFRKWRDDYPACVYHQMEIAVAILYGYVGQKHQED